MTSRSPRRPARRTTSVRWRLTALASAVVAVALVLGAVALTWVLQASRVAALDAVVRERATTVATLAEADRLPSTLPVVEPGEIVQLLDADGGVVASSSNASRTLPLLGGDELTASSPDTGGATRIMTTTTSGYDDAARVAVHPTTLRGAPATVVASVPLTELEGVVRALRVGLLAVVPLLTLAVGAVVWFILGRALRPVEALRRGAAQVARAGGPGSLPVPAADDEIGALARTLNDMLDRLETGAARQRSFVADAAHELRSPVAALRATVEVAQAHPGSTTPDELAGELLSEVLRLQALVDDLLVLARVGAGPAASDRVELGPVAAAVLAGVRPVADRRDVAVELGGAGAATGDPAALGRVLRNLLDNAVRHASRRAVVTVGEGRVTVDDDGAGLDPEMREAVFERFVRLDEARERDVGGSGLGLAIARELTREMGGDVHLGASPLGGVRAVVELPLLDAGDPAAGTAHSAGPAPPVTG
ncbi:sensor histidine kinase [Cellulosimicrobium arenosum]|uniref:histidine kinase n=1 Tax=Cellulosimicrobium arenosum TaxID=2708133 RepID=A0A927G8L8_9MICO|nr:HAMP domain-containing sensor histidine kinase [Cellulosimicrobium arenosum]MBD8078559.1 HAMP domain-containing histidine kinase [Cellulosimicrobium arenosum]